MDLHVTLAAGPGVTLPEGAPTEEWVITSAERATGTWLHQWLAEHTGADHLLVRDIPVRELQPGQPPLIQGAVVVASRGEESGAAVSASGHLAFLIDSGPDAGKIVPLPRGTYSIGRSSADIVIHDPDISRRHALLTVTNDTITLQDQDSANGVWVDDFQTAFSPVTTKSVIRMGNSRCRIVLADSPPEQIGAVDLNEPCEVVEEPPPEPNKLLILTAALPLVLGLALALTTGMWFFLAFSALSAVTGLVPLASGRRKRRAFNAAVAAAAAADSERRRRAAPDMGIIAQGTTQTRWSGTAGYPRRPHQAGFVRVGLADQSADVLVRAAPRSWKAPVLPDLPVLIPLYEGTGGSGAKPLDLQVAGPQQALTGVAQLLLLQLAVINDAGPVLCFGRGSDLPVSARFLPGVHLVSDRERMERLLGTENYSTLVLFGCEASRGAAGVRTYRFSESNTGCSSGWSLNYFPPAPVLSTPEGAFEFLPDRVRPETFTALARSIAAGSSTSAFTSPSASAPASVAMVPSAVALRELVDCDNESISTRWSAPGNESHLRCIVGITADGCMKLDLVPDGPHLLVAGTTGSGKSEFLRTLVVSIALNYSPTEANFLLIDFKGGSGLGSLSGLPHAVGLLTDLSSPAVSRALVSLKAEVKRREALFAEVGATDYVEYRSMSPGGAVLPRLVTVVDEFRMLSEEVPGAVSELMRIATLGRSLGMHLVLATQRPQGAITSEIRANITASIAFRMQSPMESQDVLHSAVASTVPVRYPGRGYVRVGTEEPLEFQSASVTAPPRLLGASIVPFTSFLANGGGLPLDDRQADSGSPPPETSIENDQASVLQSTVESIQAAAKRLGSPAPREPVHPPLPATAPALPTAGRSPHLGLLDIPELQQQRPLLWDPAADSHLVFVGLPGSGLQAALAHATGEIIRSSPDTHLYILDGDSTLRAFAEAPQLGAYVGVAETKRAARVLQRVAGLVRDRLRDPTATRNHTVPDVVVIVSGWGRWATAIRSSRSASAEDALQDIARDGEGARVILLIGGERELLASRFFSLLPNRLYLPFGASSDSLLSWPKLPAVEPFPGRACVQGRLSPVVGVAQLVMEATRVELRQPARRPFTVAALPQSVCSSQLAPASAGLRPALIPIGLGGDDLDTFHLPLHDGSTALVLGSPASGKSQTLDLIEQQAPAALRCLRAGKDGNQADYWLRLTTAPDTRDLLLVDDADRLPREVHQQLAGRVAAGARAVLTSTTSMSLMSLSSLLPALRSHPLGLILGNQSASDGDIFGLRLDPDAENIAGRGMLIDPGGAREIQVALARTLRAEPGSTRGGKHAA